MKLKQWQVFVITFALLFGVTVIQLMKPTFSAIMAVIFASAFVAIVVSALLNYIFKIPK